MERVQTHSRRDCIILLWALLVALWFPKHGTANEPPNYLGPNALAVTSDAQTLFVACGAAKKVLVIDVSSGDIQRTIDTPQSPRDIVLSADEQQLIVVCAAAASPVIVLDSKSGGILKTMTAGHTASAAVFSKDQRRLFVCNRFDNDLSVLDMETGIEVDRIPAAREPIAADLTPDGRMLVVANHLPRMRAGGKLLDSVAAEITLVDTETLETTTVELHSGASSLRDVSVSTDGQFAFVTHLLSNFENVPFRLNMGWVNVNVVSVINLRQRALHSTIGLDELTLGAANPWGIACSGNSPMIAVGISGIHELGIIRVDELLGDLARRTMSPIPGAWPVYPSLGQSLWRRVALPGKGPRSVTIAQSKAFVAEYFSDSIAVVELDSVDSPGVKVIQLNEAGELSLERRGELLFNDATICYQQWQSCASCHPDAHADGLNWDLMNDGVGNPKNTKSLLLSHRTPPSMVQGVRESAEVAVRSGITHILFSRRPEEEAVAIDAYLKSLAPVVSPQRVDGALTLAAERGKKLFHSKRIACYRCHQTPLFTDQKKHYVTESPWGDSPPHLDTPTLVEVWRTAPYLYDGRYLTVRELLVDGQHGLSQHQLEQLAPQELDDLVAFVLSL